MTISRQKEPRSRDYALLFFRMTSWDLYIAQYQRQLCTLHKCEQFVTQSTVLPVPTRHRRHACIKMRTLSQQTRRLHPMLFQCWSSVVGGGPILKQHWVKCSRLLGSTQVSVYTNPSATIIFSPADQGTFSKTAGQSQAYYNT